MPMQCPSFTSLPVASKSPLGWNLIKITDWPSWPQRSWSCLNCPSLSLQMATPPSTCPTAMMSFVMSTSLTLQGWGRICWLKKRVRIQNHPPFSAEAIRSTPKLNFASFYSYSQNSIISFGYDDFYSKIFPILCPPLENSTTRITIVYNVYFIVICTDCEFCFTWSILEENQTFSRKLKIILKIKDAEYHWSFS